MHARSLIVAEPVETDKSARGVVRGLCREIVPVSLVFARFILNRRMQQQVKNARRVLALAGFTSTLLALVLPGSQMLNELNGDATDGAQQKRVNEAAFMHHELEDEPDNEKG